MQNFRLRTSILTAKKIDLGSRFAAEKKFFLAFFSRGPGPPPRPPRPAPGVGVAFVSRRGRPPKSGALRLCVHRPSFKFRHVGFDAAVAGGPFKLVMMVSLTFRSQGD